MRSLSWFVKTDRNRLVNRGDFFGGISVEERGDATSLVCAVVENRSTRGQTRETGHLSVE